MVRLALPQCRVVPCHVMHCQSTIHRIVLLCTLQGTATILVTRSCCARVPLPKVTSKSECATVPIQRSARCQINLKQRELCTCTSLQLCHSDNAREEDVGECHQTRTVLNMDLEEITVRLLVLFEIEPLHAKPRKCTENASEQVPRRRATKLSIASGTGCTTS